MIKNNYINSLEHIGMDKLLAMDMLFLIRITLFGEKSKKMNSKEREFLKLKIIKHIKGIGMIEN